MALTDLDGEVRMFPNVPVFAIVLTLLVLYFLALVAMFPARQAFRLPHAVTCLAEIFSFLMNADLLGDEAFKDCRTRSEMLRKVGLGSGSPRTRPRWTFDMGTEINGMLGVRRMRRYTERRRVRKSEEIRRTPHAGPLSSVGTWADK
jgi:hypothetical protein